MTYKPIWENENSNEPFPAQTINRGMSDFYRVKITCKLINSSSVATMTMYCNVGDGITFTGNDSGYVVSRTFRIRTDGITVSTGYYGNSVSNIHIIPTAIYAC